MQVDHDEAYFASYARMSVHEQFLKDKTRNYAYIHAISHHVKLIRDKVVLDVGCCTGILSILCALTGAKRMYAVEAAHDIAHANMLASVITARDRWLNPGGLMLPSKATMAPFTTTQRYKESIDCRNRVYGINMSAFKPLAIQCAFLEPCVETITPENLLAKQQVSSHGDDADETRHVVDEEGSVDSSAEQQQHVLDDICIFSFFPAPLRGFAFWFDVEFGPSAIPRLFLASSSSYSVDDHPVDSQTWRDPNLLLSTAPDK
ncbi:hypothetical protein JHK82_041859 [Glycine max]|nr:hypothetical protein JHK82_041859 [Glycine max]KAG5116015.1 hypothetical protein JHK84_042128 [Glycine max]